MKVRGFFLGPPHSTDKNNSDNQSKKEGKDQESIQSSTTPDPGLSRNPFSRNAGSAPGQATFVVC